MQQITVDESTASVPVPTDAPSTEKAYGDRYFKPMILPGLGIAPILPVWLSDRLRRLFHRTDTHAAR